MIYKSLCKISILLILVPPFLSIFACNLALSQSLSPAKDNQTKKVSFADYKEHPELGSDISNIAKLKIFLRKDKYRLNEMLILDLGILTNAESMTYFPLLTNAKITVKDKSGNPIDVNKSFMVSRLFSPMLLKDGLESESFEFIIGCHEEKYKKDSNPEDETDNKTSFENNLFRTFGDGCINVKQGKEFEISVELINKYVVVPEDNEKIKTAVGTIKSNVLKIFIEK